MGEEGKKFTWTIGDKVRGPGFEYYYTIVADAHSDPPNWLMSARPSLARPGFVETIPKINEYRGWYKYEAEPEAEPEADSVEAPPMKKMRRSPRLNTAGLRNKRKRKKSNHKKRSRVVKKTKKRRR